MKLNEIQAPVGGVKKRKRVGRGPGSGHGKTSCRGHKGMRARSGGGTAPGFEGGQNPFYKRIPKRGFTNINKKEYTVINLEKLNKYFKDGDDVNYDSLLKKGLIKSSAKLIKILGQGELNVKLNIKANAFSQKAKEIIEAKGGKAEVI